MEKELWDAYDREGKLLGFDLVRGEPLPEGAWHLVAEILAVTTDGRVLVTKRHPDKHWGGLWEYTGGAVRKGETPVQGALRELREETGIIASKSDLRPVYVEAREERNTIYHSFAVLFSLEKQTIRLQEGETADYRLLPYKEFKKFIRTEQFVGIVCQRFLDHQEAFDQLVKEYFGEK